MQSQHFMPISLSECHFDFSNLVDDQGVRRLESCRSGNDQTCEAPEMSRIGAEMIPNERVVNCRIPGISDSPIRMGAPCTDQELLIDGLNGFNQQGNARSGATGIGYRHGFEPEIRWISGEIREKCRSPRQDSAIRQVYCDGIAGIIDGQTPRISGIQAMANLPGEIENRCHSDLIGHFEVGL